MTLSHPYDDCSLFNCTTVTIQLAKAPFQVKHANVSISTHKRARSINIEGSVNYRLAITSNIGPFLNFQITWDNSIIYDHLALYYEEKS